MSDKSEEDAVFAAVKKTHTTNVHVLSMETGLTQTQVDKALRRLQERGRKEKKAR